jgi:hypothetical protein
VGVEGEVSGLLGISQSLAFVNGTTAAKPPHFLNYSEILSSRPDVVRSCPTPPPVWAD